MGSGKAVGEGGLSGNAGWGVGGGVVASVCRLLIFVVLAKGYAEEQVGWLMVALAIVTPLSYLLNMELRLVLVTDTTGRVSAGVSLAMRLISNGMLAVLLLGGCWLMRDIWGTERIAVLLLVGAVRGVESMTDIYLGVLQKHERMKQVAVSQGVKTVLVLLWALGMAGWTENVWVLLPGWVAAVALIGVIYDRPQAKRYEKVGVQWDRAALRRVARLGLPTGVFVTMTSVNHNVGRYFLAGLQGEAKVAYFVAMWFVVAGVATLQNGVNQAVLGRWAKYYAANTVEFWRLLGRVLGVCWAGMAVLVGLVWWQGELIVRLIARQEYADQVYGGQGSGGMPVFVVVMLSGWLMLTGMVLGDAVVAAQRFKSRMAAVGLGLAVNALLCWSLVGSCGLAGAAWAAVAGSGVTALVCGVVLMKLRRTEINGHSAS